MKAKPYDPRPDLADDSRLWDAVLISARKHDPTRKERGAFWVVTRLAMLRGEIKVDYQGNPAA